MKQILDSNYLIPLGTELRVLLNSEHISNGEVHSALKIKGCFVEVAKSRQQCRFWLR